MLNLHQSHGKGEYRFISLTFMCFRLRDVQTPLLPLWEEGVAHRGRCFGKPLRAISRFSHQDAQTPPSLLVGEGGRGYEGQRRMRMENIAHLSQKLRAAEGRVTDTPAPQGLPRAQGGL